jgi:hypothetical protein
MAMEHDVVSFPELLAEFFVARRDFDRRGAGLFHLPDIRR